MPRGTQKNYASVRFVKLDPNRETAGVERAAEVNEMIREAVEYRFGQEGFEVKDGDADLVVAFLLIIQNNVTTTAIGEYFGYSEDRGKILSQAHKKGVIKGKHADFYEAGAVVIDLLDAHSNKLIYRNFAKRNIVGNRTENEVQAEIQAAVDEALANFFK